MVVLFKCVLIGDGAVGKTALRERFLGKGFKANYLITIGADFALATKQIDETTVKFQLWDIAGQPRFGSVRSIYYKNALGALVVFDITRVNSFKNLRNWVDEYWTHNGHGIRPLLILGNKADLRSKEPMNVSNEEGQTAAEQLSQETEAYGFSVPYLETSAKTALNVDQAFTLLGQAVLNFQTRGK
ncbi:MAG: GTP-binding protein [Candidatus Heimdallarchaeota archaeon]